MVKELQVRWVLLGLLERVLTRVLLEQRVQQDQPDHLARIPILDLQALPDLQV